MTVPKIFSRSSRASGCGTCNWASASVIDIFVATARLRSMLQSRNHAMLGFKDIPRAFQFINYFINFFLANPFILCSFENILNRDFPQASCFEIMDNLFDRQQEIALAGGNASRNAIDVNSPCFFIQSNEGKAMVEQFNGLLRISTLDDWRETDACRCL